MPPIMRVKLRWSGFTGGPGYSNFFYRDRSSGDPSVTTANDAATLVDNFGSFLQSRIPIGVNLAVQGDVEVVEETTGQLEEILNITPPAARQGTAPAAPYSAASGAVVTWRTAGVRNGRRVRGRTFCVPLASTSYDNDGTLSAAFLTAINTNLSGTAFLANTNSAILGIYARPSAPGASDGAWFQVNGFSVPDKVAVLRSRRD